MTGNLAVTIDAGTGSVKASVCSVESGDVLASMAAAYPIEHPMPGRAEWQPAVWWGAVVDALAGAVVQAGRPAGDYLGLTVTSLRQGFVLVDAAGTPVAPGVLNYDRRGAKYSDLIEQAMPLGELYRLTGHWHAPELTLPKLLCTMHEQPKVWRRAQRCLFVHDWLLYRFCGEQATAASIMAAGQMGDCANRTWAIDLLSRLDIDDALLPPVLEGGDLLGGLIPDVAASVGLPASLPVYAGGGDTQFGCLGCGGMVPGKVVVVGGSTTPIMMTTAQPIFDALRYPWVSPHLRPDFWAVETNVGHTGMIYQWFRNTFCQTQVAAARAQGLNDYAVLDDVAASAPIGAHGLLTLAASPRWAQDTWQRKAPYALFNFDVGHTLADVARSILEGVCYGIRGNLDQLERVAGAQFGAVIFTGGAARAPLWAQMLADVLGRVVRVPAVNEPSARAGAQLMLWARDERAVLPAAATVTYEPDERCTEQYEAVYRNYLACFETMQAMFT